METKIADAGAKARYVLRRELGRVRPAWQSGAPVVAAVSGGADSLALAASFAQVAAEIGVRPLVAIVDHGLQAGSAEVVERVVGQVRGLGLVASVLRVKVRSVGEGVEAAARRARYAALLEFCREKGARVLLTAHTLNDQAEQVLLALARGSGLKAVAGIAPVRSFAEFEFDAVSAPDVAAGASSVEFLPEEKAGEVGQESGQGMLLRPFLALSRAETLEICAQAGLSPWDDPHNRNPQFLRARVRHELLPALQDVLGADVLRSLARTADLAREDVAALDDIARAEFRACLAENWDFGSTIGLDQKEACEQTPAEIDAEEKADSGIFHKNKKNNQDDTQTEPADAVILQAKKLAKLPQAVRNRVYRLAAKHAAGASFSKQHTAEIDALITHWHGQKALNLPRTTVLRKGEKLIFYKNSVRPAHIHSAHQTNIR
ncbi:MAG: tRNA lysidine(34) synthetase TilS [Microbacteriaceae bacterium]|nr:tRNA lysidine(34) synthetase TilS [Microbacteriaceae bacterium]